MCTKYALPNRRVVPDVWKGKRKPLSIQLKKLDLIFGLIVILCAAKSRIELQINGIFFSAEETEGMQSSE